MLKYANICTTANYIINSSRRIHKTVCDNGLLSSMQGNYLLLVKHVQFYPMSF